MTDAARLYDRFLVGGTSQVWARAINPAFIARNAVRGVDVSEYQGQIDWEAMRGEQVAFAFIKATEGSSYVDPCFQDNWRSARENGILTGAYHFFSFDSAAETQADSFIAVVPYAENALPPVVDIEFYGKYKTAPPADKAEVVSQLNRLLDRLEDAYGKKPILYATLLTYHEYISGRFDDYPLWIRSVHIPASLFVGTRWTFWQYTDQAKLPHYTGPEPCIDMNVFNGSYEELVRINEGDDEAGGGFSEKSPSCTSRKAATVSTIGGSSIYSGDSR